MSIYSYSRKVLWLRITSTNRDPAVTMGYFLECINAVDDNYDLLQLISLQVVFNIIIRCPRVIRLDCGVENTLIAESQIAFRLHDGDALSGEKSVRLGSSSTNSVIKH